MKTILFTSVTFNLSEITMALDIARAISGDFKCHFASHGGVFEELIEKEGYPLTKLEPRFSLQTVERIYAIDQGRRIVSMHTPEQCINLERLVAKSFAMRIPRGRLNAESLCAAIEKLLADPVANEKAREYQQVVQAWDTPKDIRSFFRDTFGGDA